MSIQLLDQLNLTTRVLKRAQYEAFEFSLFDGDVIVRNESHSNPDDHEYRISIVDGVPTTCECLADQHSDGPCKHRVAVAIRPLIIESATAMRAATAEATINTAD